MWPMNEAEYSCAFIWLWWFAIKNIATVQAPVEQGNISIFPRWFHNFSCLSTRWGRRAGQGAGLLMASDCVSSPTKNCSRMDSLLWPMYDVIQLVPIHSWRIVHDRVVNTLPSVVCQRYIWYFGVFVSKLISTSTSWNNPLIIGICRARQCRETYFSISAVQCIQC